MSFTEEEIVFNTKRLSIRTPLPVKKDIELFFSIWRNPKIMKKMGFPHGLQITWEEIREQITKANSVKQIFNRPLIVEKEGDKKIIIGECFLGWPDKSGVSETDVKILPEFWGNKFGQEIKKGLLFYLFENYPCVAVKATPNKSNPASIKMQEAVGGKRTGEGVFKIPQSSKELRCEVPYFEYLVKKEDFFRLFSR
ncbi:GNAT family N-acetyltransferase [Candidatus Riflebacteria bacterium]